MTPERLQYLFDRYISQEADEEEERELMDVVLQKQYQPALLAILQDHVKNTPPSAEPSNAAEKAMVAFLRADRRQKKAATGRRRRLWSAAAACIVLVLATAAFFKQQRMHIPAKELLVADVPAGHSGAVLTLGNGKQIVLDAAGNGELAEQGNTLIRKSGDVVSYVSSTGENRPVEYNTMTTPKGRQMSLVLADGSKVWLNAASSIRFPSAFTGDVRKVEVTGEVYFEVAHANDPQRKRRIPFIVAANGTTVVVLGTHFNINAYTDEPNITTTLLEGAVNVRKGSRQVHLSPGQQSVLTPDGQLTVNPHPNTEEIMAWKEGYFHFESTPLVTVLRQFSRWYDIDIVFQGKVPEEKFFAIVKCSNSLSTVLKVLQTTNVKFTIEEGANNTTGRKLIIK
ncbi:FecR family protein [Chitinophaga sp. 22321]|uniref:FecR domain-containing protein n=1 Tax=Chitinophaga hostae TaxID=2831022 RepID=A0ABS5IXC0_9BACT|nr:FecR family protein [Chitinophaga hostae]MBS0027622.1 FecR domain-containing protein [Chitinophaga hostae]